jgi:outer membrane biogenesis lipoprotein LolB
MKKLSIIKLLSVSLLLLTSCSQDANSPEEQIQSTISAMEAAVEQRSLDSVRELVSSEYKDEWNGSRRAALRSLMFYFQGHQSIHLLTRTSDIQITDDGKRAIAIVYVGMAGKPVEESEVLIDMNADLYRFDVDLLADGDEWRVSSARWQRARPENFNF